MLRKNPGVTLVVILALALGIGANTAIFSVVNAVLLRPLPYDESDRLVFLNEKNAETAVLDEMSIAYANFLDWRAQNRVFEKIGVFNRDNYNLTGGGEPERITAGQVSADLFQVLRVNAGWGRVFTNEEDQPGGEPVVVLSYGLWQRRFGGQLSILNQPITLNGRSYTVIGIMPKDFLYPPRVEMWVPVGQLSAQPNWLARDNHPGLYAVARLKPGVTREQAQADMDLVAANLEKQYPDTNTAARVRIRPLLETFVSNVRRALWVIFAAVGFVLLIACANIANLLLARASARRKEMALRSAMGAGRWRIARQMLTESVLLSVVGAAVGLFLARWGLDLILSISPDAIPRAGEIGLDWTVLGFTIGVAFLTGILFGLVPAIQAGEVDVNETLKETGRGTSGRHWLRNSLVVVEVATTLVLLIGAGLMIRSFYLLQQVDPGFSPENVASLSISLPQKKYDAPEQRSSFYTRLLEQLQSLPNVKSAAAASGLPLGNNDWTSVFNIEPNPPQLLDACIVTPDYFKAMNIPVLKGRVFNDRDDRSHLAGKDLSKLDEGQREQAAIKSIVIDEEFARRHWPNEDPIGKRLRWGPDSSGPLLEVLGVVGRVKMGGLNQDNEYVQGYFPFAQLPRRAMTVVIKTSGDPNQVIGSARQAVARIDPDQPIYSVRTMADIRAESVAPERLNLTLLSLFAGIAFVLAIVGIYGVMSYSVTQRTHEIGIRMAIGAPRRDVLNMVARQGLKLALLGVAIGLLASFALTRVMQQLLFNVSPTDRITFVCVPLVLLAVAGIACYIPARRATKVDPLVALRYD
jgi:putative ABC transport system permease protein